MEGRIIHLGLIDRLRHGKPPRIRLLGPGKGPASRRPTFWLNHPALVYSIVLALLGALLFFGLIGMSVARETEAYFAYIWVPRLLVIVSGFLIATTLYRIIRRISR
jgi:fumarate reductase subunit D